MKYVVWVQSTEDPEHDGEYDGVRYESFTEAADVMYKARKEPGISHAWIKQEG